MEMQQEGKGNIMVQNKLSVLQLQNLSERPRENTKLYAASRVCTQDETREMPAQR